MKDVSKLFIPVRLEPGFHFLQHEHAWNIITHYQFPIRLSTAQLTDGSLGYNFAREGNLTRNRPVLELDPGCARMKEFVGYLGL